MLSLVEDIYEAAVRPEYWPVVLDRTTKMFGAKDFAIGRFDTRTGQHDTISTPIDPAFAQSYAEHWASQNFLWRKSAPLPVGQLFSFETFIERDDLCRTGLFNEWFKPQGMDQSMGANLVSEGSTSVTTTIYRPASRAAFDPVERARFAALLPHLQRAVQIRTRLLQGEQDRADLRATLAALDKPALLVDRDATILFANHHAEKLISAGVLGGAGGRRLSPAAAEAEFLHLIGSALTEGGSGGRIAIRRALGAPITLLGAPLHEAASFLAKRTALILIDDPDHRAVSPPDQKLLRAAYNLTGAEAKVAAAVLSGSTLRQAADDLGISFSTVRTHLSHVFEKCNVNSQVRLVEALMKAGMA